ncbi:hypothetical protein ACF0H5_004980 [Mactra antiquata]
MAITNEKGGLQANKTVLRIFLDIVLFFFVALPALYMFVYARPTERGFFCDDNSISYPYKPDTISTSMLIAINFVISIIVIVLVEILNCIDTKCRQACLTTEGFIFCLKSYSIFLLGLVIQLLIVEVTKAMMGTLRPNFLDVCRPVYNASLCPGYISEYTCTGSYSDEIRSSRQSFPSGHSSFSMYFAVYLCIHLQIRSKFTFSTTLRFILQMSLIFMSLLCGFGRIVDNKHHPGDVIVGFIVGSAVAVAVYMMVGRDVLKTSSYSSNDTLPVYKCCNNQCSDTCEQTQEPQTPSPLLDNDFMNNVSIIQSNSNSTFLKDTPFYVRRHCSTPITPSTRKCDI